MSAAVDAVVETDAVEKDPASKRSAPTAPGAPAGRSLSGEKAQRIVEAMRRSVARRGTAGRDLRPCLA